MKLLIPAFAALLASPVAFGAEPLSEPTGTCTQAEADALALQVAERINDIIDNDPQRAAAINNELQQMRLHRTAETLENECRAYRIRLAEIKKARKEAGLRPADELDLMPGLRGQQQQPAQQQQPEYRLPQQPQYQQQQPQQWQQEPQQREQVPMPLPAQPDAR